MREIKFRGKKLCQDEWIYGSLITRGERGADGNFIDTGRGECYPLQQDTIGQYTGLHDKNGKEIYEGDIIYIRMGDGSDCHCLIGYDEMLLGFGIMDEYAYRSTLRGYSRNFDNGFMHRLYRDSKIFEVRGNLYDNPELLKGDKV